jgi:hypothetical protein
MMKTLENLTVSTLRIEEMFNVRGGEGETTTSASNNTIAEGEDEDVIL